MKTLTYEYAKMVRAGELLNSLVVSGSSNFRALAEIANILDSGKPGEIVEEAPKEEKKDGKYMAEQKVQQDKLAK